MKTSSTLKLGLQWKSKKAENEDELSEKLIEAKDEIQLLKENQSITLGNIF